MERNLKSNKKSPPMSPHLPFVFANKGVEEDECSTSSSYMKTNVDQSFIKELTKIGVKTGSILDTNPAKCKEDNKFSPAVSPSGRFPYQRKARSISPPKDSLTICERNTNFFFPAGSPIVPDNSLQGNLPQPEDQEEDNDLLVLKQQYLKLLMQAPNLNFKSELFESEDDFSGTEEFNEWESSIMKKMQLH